MAEEDIELCPLCGALPCDQTEKPLPPFESGRFGEWPNRELAGQCRMQARENLDPDYCRFMLALAERLDALPTSNRIEGM